MRDMCVSKFRCAFIPGERETTVELPPDVIEILAALGIRHQADGGEAHLRFDRALYFRRCDETRGLEPIDAVYERLRERDIDLALDGDGAVSAPRAGPNDKRLLGALYRERQVEWLSVLAQPLCVTYDRGDADEPLTACTFLGRPDRETCAPRARDWWDGTTYRVVRGSCYRSREELETELAETKARERLARERRSHAGDDSREEE